uniref:Nonstructural protein NS1 n=1 Tax=Cecropis daurica ambidensovirus TaxID=2794443 RepID=A0A8E7G1Z8_9VIRU|nr:MAG: nonstructural protein NS1 [Cecropis daurica ambidensovirus]
MLSDPNNIKYIQASLDDFGKDLNELTLREIYNILTENTVKPIFIKSMEYGTLEDSTNWINDLLEFQFDEEEELITQFLVSLVDVLDRRIPKCNGLSVIAPPSSGKNFFFDMIFALCLNYGQLGQANKHNVFAFQEAPNKRVLVWNEPNYESSLTDTIKMMMGGDPYTVRVKHNMDTHVARTPVIILSNVAVGFHNDLAFKDRIVKFKWKAAPFLKNIDLKPYPMCFFNILNKYNISFYNIVLIILLYYY